MEEVHVDLEKAKENTESSKRKLEKTVLDNFANIIKPQEAVRVKGGTNILKYLLENNTKKENEIRYSLVRLIRGLGSSAIQARTGFFSTLVGLIDTVNEIGISTIFEHIEKELHKSGSNSKGENADIAAGQILACGAIIRSRLWINSTNDDRGKVITLLIKASKERSYLGSLAYTFIVMGLEKIHEKQIQKIFPILENEINKPWQEQNLDSLYLLINLRYKCSKQIDSKFLKKSIGTNEIICTESLDELCHLLLTIPRLSSIDHPLYELIAKDLASSELLKHFIIQLDQYLETPNRNKQLVVINLYTLMLPLIIKTSNIPVLLSKNFIQQILAYFKASHVKDKDPEFKKSVHNFFEVLLTTVKKEQIKSITKLNILKKLLFFPGTFIFEKITKSKIVQLITASLDNEGVKSLGALYRGVIEGTEKIDNQKGDNENWLNNDRLYAARLLIKLLNHNSVKDENGWKVDQLCFLMKLGLFKSDEQVNVGTELAASLKTAFYNALDLKLSKLEDLLFILTQLVHDLDSKLNLENLESILRSPITESDYNTWKKALHLIHKIEKKKRKGHGNLKMVFLTLFVNMSLQLFTDSKLATDSLQELFICYEKTRKNRKDSINSEDFEMVLDTQESDSSDPLWIEVVVDLFLNLLSHNSHLLRNVINCVFPHLCQYMTAGAIQHILGVLDPKNEDNPLSRIEEDSDESDEELEVEKDEEEDEKSDESSEDDEISDKDEEDVDIEDESTNDKLRMALHQVLMKNNGYQTDEESVDLDEMSETEGKKLDEALAAAFKQYRPRKGKLKKQNKDEESLTHFRIRVLDLIEIYLDSTPSMSLTLEIMLPLLQAVEFSIRDEHQKPLHARLKSCLKKLTAIKKFDCVDGVDDVILHDLLRSLLEKGTRTSWIIQDMSVQIADCCIFIIKCSDNLISIESTPQKIRKKLKKSISELICTELENYFHKRDSAIPIVLFKNIMKLSWDGNLSVVPYLLQYVFKNDIKPFKKNQAAELLKLFYLNQRYLMSNPEGIKNALNDTHSQFSDTITTFFNSLCDNLDQRTVKEKFICSLFNVLIAMRSCCLNIDNINWAKIGEVIREYRSHVTFSKDAKGAFNRLCNRLGIPNVVKMKEKIIKLNGNHMPEQNEFAEPRSNEVEKKNKKLKNKDKLQLKKKTKELRLKSLSEGFNDIDFAAAATVSENEEPAEPLEEHKSEKKRKHNGNLEEIKYHNRKRNKL